MTGTLRALDMGVMAQLKSIVRTTCENIASGQGGEAQIEYTTEYPVLYNDRKLTEITAQKIRTLIGEDNVFEMDTPSLGADDFAFFCEQADCCYFNLGCRAESQGDGQILHSAYLAPDESCIRTALEILCTII